MTGILPIDMKNIGKQTCKNYQKKLAIHMLLQYNVIKI